jgi:hypothetical protein
MCKKGGSLSLANDKEFKCLLKISLLQVLVAKK